MTHTYTITAETYDEVREHIQGPDAFSVLRTLDEHLRAVAKYGNGLAEPGDLTGEAATRVRGHLHNLLRDEGISLFA